MEQVKRVLLVWLVLGKWVDDYTRRLEAGATLSPAENLLFRTVMYCAPPDIEEYEKHFGTPERARLALDELITATEDGTRLAELDAMKETIQ